MKVVLAIAIAGCGAAAPPPPRSPPPVVELEVPPEEPAPPRAPPPPPDRGLGREEMILREHGSLVRRPERDVALAESQFWDPCVRQFVGAQPDATRRVLTTVFKRYATACDADGRVVLQLARGVDGRERRGKTDVGFVGTFAPNRIDLSLRVAYCSAVPPVAEHVSIIADEVRWTSNRLDFVRDEHGCEVAELPVTRSLRRALRTAVESPDALVRLEGNRGEDVAIGEDMKQDMRVMLNALDVLRP